MLSGLFTPRARYSKQWSGHVAVLAPGVIPTVDYYLTARLNTLKADAVSRFDAYRPADAVAEILPQGTFWVIVRHASAAWLDMIERYKARWSGVAFLMDDDIPAAWRCRDVPMDYGLWTSGRFWRARPGLASVCDRIWFSTATLQQRYAAPASALLPPLPFDAPASVAPIGCRRWGYHGTRIHHREIRWLLPVVQAVQQAVPEAQFEIFGDARVARWFRDIPRATVLAPLAWPQYVQRARENPLALALAPMLPGPFNAARSHTKAYDIARCGAVGLFSAREPYASALADAGMPLLVDRHEAWIEAAIALLDDDAARLECHARFIMWLAGQGRGDHLARYIEHAALIERQP